MKKRLFTLLFALMAMVTVANAQVVFNATNFPDPNFRAALMEQVRLIVYSHNSDGECIRNIRDIREGDVIYNNGFYDDRGHFHEGGNCSYTYRYTYGRSNKVDYSIFDIAYKSITNLTGIEHFTILEWLECYDNQLTSLDVSQNTALKKLSCDRNQLTSLDVSGCTALKTLSCGRNQLTSLDVSKNAALTELMCGYNQLTSLDVSKNTALTLLDCSNNQLTDLALSENVALTHLSCNYNQLTLLDVAKNTKLTDLRCYGNQIKGAAMDALVASLPTVKNGEFIVINTKDENEGNVCTKSQVAAVKGKGWTVYDFNGRYSNRQEYEGSEDSTAKLLLNAANFPDANFRAALASILGISEGDEITAEKIAATTSLNVSKPSNALAEEKIADLTGIEHFTALTELYCLYNQLTALDVSKNTALTELGCFNNQLTLLNVSGCTALTTLICDNNQLTSLDVSGCSALFRLYCDNNQLNSLDVTGCTALKYLFCDNNQLNSLDVSGCTALTTLMCDNNQLNSLDVSKKTALTTLWCDDNQLTSLDVSGCTALTSLNCFSNKLTSLDASGCTALRGLLCYSNQIKGKEMDALVASLPTVESSNFYVIDTKNENEGNVCTKAQVAVAKGKGWTVYDNNGGSKQEYEGSDDTTAIDASLNDNGQRTNDSWYTIDGVKLNGEPTKKGIYIYNGKKVKK